MFGNFLTHATLLRMIDGQDKQSLLAQRYLATLIIICFCKYRLDY